MFVRLDERRYVNLEKVDFICFRASRKDGKRKFVFYMGSEYVESKAYDIDEKTADAVIKYVLEKNGNPMMRIVDLDKIVESIKKAYQRNGFINGSNFARC